MEATLQIIREQLEVLSAGQSALKSGRTTTTAELKRGMCAIGTAQEELKTDITTQINIIYRIQQHPTAKLIVIHLDGLAPYRGATQDK
jgi:hypothetical protein